MANNKHVVEYTDVVSGFSKVKDKIDNIEIDADQITSGVIDINRLPKSALERLVYVTDDEARFKLTTQTVQNGDTVKVNSTGNMYFVVDENDLASESGYEPYTSSIASAVAWESVTNKPQTYTPSGHSHAIADISNLASTLNNLRTDIDRKPNEDTNTTYKLSQSGRTITLTDSEGVTSSVTTVDTDTNTTYTLTQDANDGHKLTFKGTDGTTTNITIPDNDTKYDINTMIGGLSEADSTPTDSNYLVSQSGTDKAYKRTPFSKILDYLKSKFSYNDLKDKPTIGNGKVTIKQNGTEKASFSMNQTGSTTVELTDTNTNTWRDVVDGLTSDRTDASLSAKQGKVLKGLIDGKANNPYIYSKTVTSASSSTWYVKVTLDRPWANTLDKMIIRAPYHNVNGTVYLEKDSYDDKWTAYTTNYNLTNITGIATTGATKTYIFIRLTGYSDTTGICQFECGYPIQAMEVMSENDGSSTVFTDIECGRTSNTRITTTAGFYGNLNGYATGTIDYNNNDNKIKIGYSGTGLTVSEIGYLAGYAKTRDSSGALKIKDIDKDALKSWLGLNSFAYTSYTNELLSEDKRDVATKPSDYNSKFIWQGLKRNSTIGLSSEHEYSYLIGLRGWNDNSGGHTHELAFNNTDIFRRIGTGDATWSNWAEMLDSANYTKYAAQKAHTHTKSQITDFPTSLPASDVYAWAKASTKPSYSWGEITGKPTTFTPSSHKQAYTASECSDYTSDDNTLGLTPAAVKKAFTIFEPKAHTHNYLPLSGGTMSGNIEFINTESGYFSIGGTIGNNDYWRVGGGATGANAGYLEIATADDGNEPIYVRQYSSGKFGTLARTATLLDGSGNTVFPGTVTAASFNGNATTATNLSGFVNTTTSPTAIDNAITNGHVYVNNTSGIYGQNDGAAFVQAYSSSWVSQIYQDYRTGQIALRSKNNGTWQSWRKVIDTGNSSYLDYIGSFAYFGSDSEGSGGWYKVYSATLTGYSNHVARLSIISTYNAICSGVINLHLRCENDATVRIRQLEWETRRGFDAGQVIINTNGNTWSLYVKQTNARYGRIKVRVLECAGTAGATTMELYSNFTKETTDPVATATAYDGYTVSTSQYANHLNITNTNEVRFSKMSGKYDLYFGYKWADGTAQKLITGYKFCDGNTNLAPLYFAGGTVYGNLSMNNSNSITNLPLGGGIYWNPYAESSTDPSDAASITVSTSGGATTMTISQQNDSNDTINLVAGDVNVNGSHILRANNCGTITDRITRNGGGSWISDRNNVVAFGTSTNSDSYNPVVGQKTPNGAWTMGNLALNESLVFNYSTDTNYNAGTNTTTQVYLRATSGTIALLTDIPTNTNQLTNGAGYITGITKDMVTAALGYTPPTTNTTYGAATTSSNGLMTSAMVTKLNGIATGATAVTESDGVPTRTMFTINNTDYNCCVYRIGDFCLAVVALEGTIYSRQWLKAAQLPSGFAPSKQSSVMICGVSGSDHMECMVRKDGYIMVWWSGSSYATTANICVPYYIA